MNEGTTSLRTEIVAELQRYAVPLTTVQPRSGFADLLPLKELIGDARIVALGEATHGTHEFFLLKHRLLEFLVKEMQFTVFAIEANWAESNLINEYVQTGNGDPVHLLAGLHFWTWNTQEVLDMILWMRAHNEAPGTAPLISFQGFDMQYFSLAMEKVLSYLHTFAPEAQEEVQTIYESFRNVARKTRDYEKLPTQNKLHHRATYEELSSPEQFAHALQSARLVIQAEQFFAAEAHNVRDQFMAENVSWLLEQAGPMGKIVLWAHNGHVGVRKHSMGAHLRKRYGDALVIIGLSFSEGTFHAYDLNDPSTPYAMLAAHQAFPPPDDSYEQLFAAAGLPQMLLNLHGLPEGSPLAEWLAGPHLFRYMGATYAAANVSRYVTAVSLPKAYDCIIHLQQATPSSLLSTRYRFTKRNLDRTPRQPHP